LIGILIAYLSIIVIPGARDIHASRPCSDLHPESRAILKVRIPGRFRP
jgi:hypothetical protein